MPPEGVTYVGADPRRPSSSCLPCPALSSARPEAGRALPGLSRLRVAGGAGGPVPSTSGLCAPGPGQPGAGLSAQALRTTAHAGRRLGGPRRRLSFPGRAEAQFHIFTARAPCRECPWGPRWGAGSQAAA